MSPLPSLSDVLLRTQTDERLARLVRDGQDRAFAILVQRHRGAMLRLASRVVGSGRGEDVVQQALLRAWVSLGAGTEVRNVQAWLFQILRNTAYNEYARTPPATAPVPEELADLASSGMLEHRELVQELVKSIAALPEHQRTALVETALGGRSRQQIAAEMGVSEGAVRQLVHRARTTVRMAMTAIVPYPVVAWASRHAGGSIGGGVTRIGDAGVAARSSALAEPAASGAAAGGALIVKGGVALLAAGAVAGGVGWHALAGHSHHRVVRAGSPAPAISGRADASHVVRSLSHAGSRAPGSVFARLVPRGTAAVPRSASQDAEQHSGRSDSKGPGFARRDGGHRESSSANEPGTERRDSSSGGETSGGETSGGETNTSGTEHSGGGTDGGSAELQSEPGRGAASAPMVGMPSSPPPDSHETSGGATGAVSGDG